MPKSLLQVVVDQGAVIFREGDPPDYAYLIDYGEVNIVTSECSHSKVVAVLSKGDIFGEMAIIDSLPRSAAAVARTECLLSVIGPENILERLERSDLVISTLVRVMSYRLRNTRCESRVVPGPVPPRFPGRPLGELRVDQAIRAAVLVEQFVPFLQPIVALPSGCLVGYEALARWRSEDGGFVAPDSFVPVAERTQAIRGIDICILNAACQAISRINRERSERGLEPAFISVNFSGLHFSDLGVIDLVKEALVRNELRPGLLHVEITESVLVANQDMMYDILNKFKEIGICIALDDFGVGFSNLAYLEKLPIDVLKIDRSFCTDHTKKGRLPRIVQAITGLARVMDMQVVAEGIETLQQAGAMSALGCHFGQGFLFGAPRAEDSVPISL